MSRKQLYNKLLVAATQIDPLYLPDGANIHLHLTPLDPNEPGTTSSAVIAELTIVPNMPNAFRCLSMGRTPQNCPFPQGDLDPV